MVRMDELPLSPEPLYDAVGRVAVAWAAMELELARLLPALLHTPRADLLSTGQDFAVLERQLPAFEKLAPQAEQYDAPRERLTAAQRARITEVLQEARALSKRRRRIIHGVWVPTDNPNAWISLKPERYKIFVEPEEVTLEDMHQVARDIDALSVRIGQLGANVDYQLYGVAEAPPLDGPTP
jgi:hypothetical protein